MMNVLCFNVLWLLCLCAPCWSVPLDGEDSDSSSGRRRLAGRWKRQEGGAEGSKPNGQDSATPGLARLSFSELQPSSSGHYTSNCCDIVPQLCSSAGKCTLKVTDCVSFCICARTPDLPWCADELHRLQEVLRRRGQGDGGGEAAGSGAEGADSEALAGHQPDSKAPLTHGGLSLNGTALGGLDPSGSTGGAEEESHSPEDSVMSPALLASSLTAALGDAAMSSQDDVTGDTGSTDSHSPPLAAMANGDGDDKGNTSRARLDLPHDGGNASSKFLNSRTPSVLSQNNSSLNDTQRHSDPLFNNRGHDLKNTNSNPDNGTGITTTAPTTTSDQDVQILLPWWHSDGGSCGMECELNGGRCVFEFNQTHTEVCVYDVTPCHKLNCVHGTCVARNDTYSCDCDQGWGGIFCTKECPLDCSQHGRCVVIQDDVMCNCDAEYSGVNCSELKPTPPPWNGGSRHEEVTIGWQIAAGCLGVTALLLLLLLLLAYIMWRRQWLPMRKLVHYFQQYEEDDGKEYDAFVSYRSRSRDEMFVLHELYPHLERHLDFKLCMHFRDFPPGETIADNIIHAIENSRRTILVLSPAYVQSEWCRLEYQKAQHEMLKLRHKIIPIMIEDVSHVSPVDRNLRTILDTVTYIQWPGNEDSKRLDKFWKLLQLSMPKKKSDYTRSLSSAESCGSDRPLTAVSSSCFHHVVSSMSDHALQPQRSLSITSSLEEAAEGEGEGADANGNTAVTCCGTHHNCDNGCLRDSAISSSPTCLGDSPPGPRDIGCPVEKSHSEDVTHTTSDDHIVEIREFPGHQVKITPWLPARISTRC